MPAVLYYRCRPARFWIAAMSGPARATAANPAAATSPASPRPATPAARLGTPEETSAPAATAVSTSAWEAWASNWFTPNRRPYQSSKQAIRPGQFHCRTGCRSGTRRGR